MWMVHLALSTVIFNRGSAESKGSASICQGFRSWSVKKFLKITYHAKLRQTKPLKYSPLRTDYA